MSAVYEAREPSYYEPYLARFDPLSGPFLELGAGYGLLLELLRERGIEAKGVEFMPERVRLCESKGLDVLEHDLADRLPFDDGTFACVYSGQVIEHCPPKTQRMMLYEAFRVLRPGGQLQVCSPCRNHEASRLQPGHDYLLTPSELNALLAEAGFEEIKPYNRPQNMAGVPKAVQDDLWKRYRPDLLSISASAICRKPAMKPRSRRKLTFAAKAGT